MRRRRGGVKESFERRHVQETRTTRTMTAQNQKAIVESGRQVSRRTVLKRVRVRAWRGDGNRTAGVWLRRVYGGGRVWDAARCHVCRCLTLPRGLRFKAWGAIAWTWSTTSKHRNPRTWRSDGPGMTWQTRSRCQGHLKTCLSFCVGGWN